MAEKQTNIGSPRKGMNTDKSPIDLSETEYSFSLNSNIASEIGDTFLLQDEPSNLLCINFPEGFKVIGRVYEVNSNRTYFFLTNPATGVSEIGYTNNLNSLPTIEDLEQECNCNLSEILATPLENTTQTPTCNYTPLLNDECNLCLGFSITYPIRKIEIKYEFSGTTLWWTDRKNTLRYLDVDNIDQYLFTGLDSCGDDNTIPTCLDCEKLRVFKDFQQPVVKAEAIQQGGRLPAGTYEVAVAYSDLKGNEISSYYSNTNPVSIFDRNNTIISQQELEYETNFGIRFSIDNLDLNYPYYKVAVIYSGGIGGTSYYSEGVHSTSDKEINIVSIKGLQPITFQKIATLKKSYERADGLTSSNGTLFWHGTTEQEEINFQPCANLLGGFLRWITVEAPEDLYKDGVNDANYKGYMRDEVYPVAIQLLYNNGTSSADFPLISRPASTEERVKINNTDTQSLLAYSTNCSNNDRDEYWQFYNTATDEGYYGAGDIDNYNTVEKPSLKTCLVDGVYTSSTLEIPIDCSYPYTSLSSYIETYRNDICNPSALNYNAELCGILSDDYSEDTCNFQALFGDNCDLPPELVEGSTEVFLSDVEQETVNSEYVDIDDMEPTPPPQTCLIYKPGTNAFGYEDDTAFVSTYMDAGEKAYKRNPTGTNTACAYSTGLTIGTNYSTFLDYSGAILEADLLTTKTSLAATNYPAFVNKKALWYKIEFGNLSSVVFEATEKTNCDNTDDIPIGTTVRLTTFNNCSTNAYTYSQIVDLSDGDLIQLNKADYPSGIAYIAIDSPIRNATKASIVSPPCGCFNVLVRPLVCLSRTIVATNAVFSKREQYTTTCEFRVPIADGCTPTPFKYGKFGYWESTDTYPDNEELYNSSNLSINLEEVPTQYQAEFSEYYLDGGNLNADFRCQPIRHFKFPDFEVAPFMSTEEVAPFSDSFIYPLGVSIDEDLINYFLDVAVDSNLMTQAQRDSVKGYKIKVGDRTLNKSIIAKGLSNDMFSYTETGATNPSPILFPNFPYNDNHENKLLFNNTNRNSYIQPPNNGAFNSNYTFHSPDTSFLKPTIPTELKIECHQFGRSRGNFVSVEDHVEEVVLGRAAYTTATTLGVAEAALEALLNLSELTISANSNLFLIGGVANGTNAAGVAYANGWAVAYGVAAIASSFIKVGQYRKQWLDIIDGLGQPKNFASYYTSVGKYNWAVPNTSFGNKLRAIKTNKYLKPGNYQFTEEVTGQTIKINNRDRESSVFISTGTDYPITNPAYYIGFDDSRIIASDLGCENNNISSTAEQRIASPYMSLKNYLPNQYGEIGDIKWISTGYTGNLETPQLFPQIFGGDVYITRFAKKIKHPMFKATAMNLAPRTPFSYSIENNVGVTRFFGDFYTTQDSGFSSALFPDTATDYVFDCLTGNNDTYVKNPSKFYTAYYGMPYFLVESEINLDYRYAKEGLQNDFYPNTEDFINYTQEKNVPLREDNTYFYNNVYSKKTTQIGNRSLPIDYNQEYYKKITYLPNNVFWSLQDNSDLDKFEPWLAYRPLDFYNFKADLGRLIDLTDIESAQVIGRFENGFLRYNAIDELRQRITPETQELGTGGIFAQRPLEYKRTKLGYAGTQHTEVVSCEFGHFWVDAKRGQIFQLDQNGSQVKDITEGKTRWFKEQLPFKILKTLPNVEIDNSFNGVGITMAWDSKYKRVVLTKKDYIVKNQCVSYDKELGFLCDDNPVDVSNTIYFEEASWTAAYSPLSDSWISYYSFKPNYYISHQDYFQSGLNVEGASLWSHLLTNRSYRVFYGDLYPWTIEVPQKTTLDKKILSDVKYIVDSERFHNEYDAAPFPNVAFNGMVVWNATNNSGYLKLTAEEKNNLYQKTQYPITNADSQEVLVTKYDDIFSVNYFFNRVKSENNNLPVWVKDNVDVEKTLNYDALTYRSPLPERMKGNWFLIRYYKTDNSNIKSVFKFNITDEYRYP